MAAHQVSKKKKHHPQIYGLVLHERLISIIRLLLSRSPSTDSRAVVWGDIERPKITPSILPTED